MDRLITTDTGGLPITVNDWRWFLGEESNQSIIDAIENLLRGESGNADFIIQGCVVTGSNPTKSMTEGWIMLAGEILKVEARSADLDDSTDSHFIKSTSFDSAGDKTALNGSAVQMYQKNRGILSGTSGNLDVTDPIRFNTDINKGWATPTFAAGDYVGSGGTWTVAAGDVLTSRFVIVGKTMHWTIRLQATTTASLPSSLAIQIPGSVNAKSSSIGLAHYINAGTGEVIIASFAAGTNDVTLQRVDGTDFANGTDDQFFSFHLTFEIE